MPPVTPNPQAAALIAQEKSLQAQGIVNPAPHGPDLPDASAMAHGGDALTASAQKGAMHVKSASVDPSATAYVDGKAYHPAQVVLGPDALSKESSRLMSTLLTDADIKALRATGTVIAQQEASYTPGSVTPTSLSAAKPQQPQANQR